ncbi:MAG: isoprenylcysteine carboxylmethyltransferase family protein [Rhizobiaceae bacterium]|nr:isoprenylcysteine carboxylmethyltransferase family protein [Rhizobiaceae bacterium]MCV0404735.1 isoprenylcysteine carboxylmethyltransferase family protein [Rhizobiaceae bacterium]
MPAPAPAGPRSALHRFQRARRLVLGGLILFLFAIFLFVRSALPEAAHEAVEAIGLGLIVVGIGGRLWSTLYVGGRKAAEIVTAGPYSVTRNPLYLFSTVASVGIGAQMGSVSTAFLFGALCALAFHIVILREERFLAETFGRPYRAYLDRVPRFWPRFRLYRDEDTVSFRPDRLRRTLIDGLVFFLAFPAFEMIEVWQDGGVLPVLFRVP